MVDDFPDSAPIVDSEAAVRPNAAMGIQQHRRQPGGKGRFDLVGAEMRRHDDKPVDPAAHDDRRRTTLRSAV